MQWDALLMSFVGLYAVVKCYSLYRLRKRLKFLGLLLAAAFFVITQLSLVVEAILSGYNLTIYSTYIVEWGHVVSLAFILSALAIFIRESKPVFAQFPLLYSALPILIVLSYVLVTDTFAIKEWLVSIYQGGAILVAALMYSVYSYRDSQYLPVLYGIGLFIIAFILFWYIPGIRGGYSWIWQLFLAAAVLVFTYGIEQVNIMDTDNRQAQLYTGN